MLFSILVFSSSPLLASLTSESEVDQLNSAPLPGNLISEPEETPEWVAQFGIALGEGYTAKDVKGVQKRVEEINSVPTPINARSTYSYKDTVYQALLHKNFLIFSPVRKEDIDKYSFHNSFVSTSNAYYINHFIAWTRDHKAVQGIAFTKAY